MREIKFRGKRIDNGKWEYGFFFKSNTGRTYIITFCDDERSWKDRPRILYIEVDSSTVGQYTGLKDKNGKEIYEGDIVSGTALSRERTGVIVWIGQLAGFGIRYTERDDSTAWQESSILKDIEKHEYSEFCAEVIGNIHDNPELLERGKEE